MDRTQIINHFINIEIKKNIYSEEYIDAIDGEIYLEDLVETVATWIKECKGDKNKAATYILQTLDIY